MRFILGAIAALAIGWTGWWFAGSTAKERALAGWFEARRTEGWVAEYAGLEVGGFPYRFDTTFTGLELADPQTGIAWTAPRFQIVALAYRPGHIIAIWPDRQVLATPQGKAEITANRLRGSVVFDPGADLALNRLTIEAEGLTIAAPDPAGGAERALLATRRHADDPLVHDLAINAQAVLLPAGLRALLDPDGGLPDRFDALEADIALGFDRPVDRRFIEERRPNITRLHIRKFRADWGRLALRLGGKLKVDPEGRPEGEITIRAENWQDMLQMAVSAGALTESDAGTLATVLGLAARLSGKPETLDATLNFSGGLTYLGPVPIGPAPRIALP